MEGIPHARLLGCVFRLLCTARALSICGTLLIPSAILSLLLLIGVRPFRDQVVRVRNQALHGSRPLVRALGPPLSSGIFDDHFVAAIGKFGPGLDGDLAWAGTHHVDRCSFGPRESHDVMFLFSVPVRRAKRTPPVPKNRTKKPESKAK